MNEEKNKDLEILEQKINEIKESKNQTERKNVSRGTNVLIEISAAIMVGILVGWYLDSTFNSKPIGMILCTIFGFMAGIKKLMSSKY
ncbi:MAG: putative F0F1-ATPase subunit Ca2+/Mg2+ transporter [Rickettsiaceae bacterium]|jgi:F0F1-type ATP synthase assembly protein I|nr:putative F0F1-ATPase subunit Ca2+/Mg2+ transporter [Rickettsiaceae bacterium]